MTRTLLGMAALCALLVLGSRLAADQGERTDNAETMVAEQLHGAWLLVSVELGGMKIDLPMNQQITITFNGGKATMNDGMRNQESTYKLDSSKTPKEIDITGPQNQGNQLMKGIYKIDGETLKIGFSPNGPMGARPKTFDDKDAGVMILKRKKG